MVLQPVDCFRIEYSELIQCVRKCSLFFVSYLQFPSQTSFYACQTLFACFTYPWTTALSSVARSANVSKSVVKHSSQLSFYYCATLGHFKMSSGPIFGWILLIRRHRSCVPNTLIFRGRFLSSCQNLIPIGSQMERLCDHCSLPHQGLYTGHLKATTVDIP